MRRLSVCSLILQKVGERSATEIGQLKAFPPQPHLTAQEPNEIGPSEAGFHGVAAESLAAPTFLWASMRSDIS
jgi:hypothetical protein